MSAHAWPMRMISSWLVMTLFDSGGTVAKALRPSSPMAETLAASSPAEEHGPLSSFGAKSPAFLTSESMSSPHAPVSVASMSSLSHNSKPYVRRRWPCGRACRACTLVTHLVLTPTQFSRSTQSGGDLCRCGLVPVRKACVAGLAGAAH
eukprot:6177093-Pleurochrysis_carterae.AAC.4